MATWTQVRWRALGAEMSALASLAVTMAVRRWLLPEEDFDPAAPHPTPVVLVHGLLGDPTNFLVLRRFLAARGVRNFKSFSYRPRIDHQRLARELGRSLDALCQATGVERVDVVGHSLGGVVARYLIDMGAGRRVRRLATLGSPYYTYRLPERELAIFGAGDPIVPAPDPVHGPYGRVLVVPDCGHLGLLSHPRVLHEVAGYLTRPAERPGTVGRRFLRRSPRSPDQPALRPRVASARRSPMIRPS